MTNRRSFFGRMTAGLSGFCLGLVGKGEAREECEEVALVCPRTGWAYPTDGDILAALSRSMGRKWQYSWEDLHRARTEHSTFDRAGRDAARAKICVCREFFRDLQHLKRHRAEGYGFVEFPPARVRGGGA